VIEMKARNEAEAEFVMSIRSEVLDEVYEKIEAQKKRLPAKDNRSLAYCILEDLLAEVEVME